MDRIAPPRAVGPTPPPAARATQLGVTVIDLDRTITRRGTYTLFLLHVARRHAPWRLALAPAVLACMIAYKLKLVGRRRLKEVMHRLMIGPRLRRADADALAEGFAERIVRHGCFEQARGLIADEQRDGRVVILATAAHHLYAAEIAARLGIVHVVATKSVWQGDFLLPTIQGENCYGPEKLERVRRYLRVLGLAREHCDVRFYSDDASDAPLFEWCDEAVAVNASAKLRALSRARDWPTLDWRRNAAG